MISRKEMNSRFRKFGLFFVLVFSSISCAPNHTESKTLVEVIKVGDLQEILISKSDQIQVINFWATWCAPCIKELPFFEKLNTEMDARIDVTLISLDFLDELEEKVIPFVKARNLKSKVVLLDEIDYNSWIDLVDPTWGGAIPFPLIVNTSTGQRILLAKELYDGELEMNLKEFLN